MHAQYRRYLFHDKYISTRKLFHNAVTNLLCHLLCIPVHNSNIVSLMSLRKIQSKLLCLGDWLLSSANLCDRIINSLIITGDDRLQIQGITKQRCDQTDSSTLLQVFQSLHYKENFALINTAHQLGFYFIKGQSVLNIAGCLNGMKSAANRYVFRIHDEYFHILQLIRNQMNHIIRSAQTAGQCDCNYLLKAVRSNLVKNFCYTLSAWQRGLRNLPFQALIYLLRCNINTIEVFRILIYYL